MTNHVLTNLKAYAALVGAVLTAMIGSLPDAPLWLTVASAVCTAVATWAVTNVPAPVDPGNGYDGP